MDAVAQVRGIIRADPLRWHLLGMVRDLVLPDCWIGAGFVRNAIWDYQHRRSTSPLDGDVDVVWFEPRRIDPFEDRKHEIALCVAGPSVVWSEKNQAGMHVRNSDAPYTSLTEAMRYWPETATAVAARRNDRDECEIAAPFGLEDLLGLVLQPTPRFTREKYPIYDERLRAKQ